MLRTSTIRWLALAIAVWLVTTGLDPQAASASVESEIEIRLVTESAAPRGAEEHEEFLALLEFYKQRAFAPVWLAADGLTEQGSALITVLRNARDNGLEGEDYDVGVIEFLRPLDSDESRAELDYLLSRGLLRYGADLHSGRLNPRHVDPELFVYPRYTNLNNLIEKAASSDDVVGLLVTLAPDSREYRRLKHALSAYREIARKGGWKPIPEGETLKPGMVDPRVPLLRERLVQIGDLTGPAGSGEVFDDTLVEAVKRFQYRHGLDQDGAVGKKTTAAFNVPVEARIDQMLLNMERRRWMAGDPGETYIFVNLADFVLKVVDGDRTIYDMRVVVGAPYHRTPVFSGEMTYLEINPYWNIPPSIATKELLPKIKKDVSYLANQNIRVFDGWDGSAAELDPYSIDWAQVSSSNFGYKLRQDPGEGNSLGRIKFMFPNQFNVYLHDTPARALFDRTVRSFSHGCIRLHKPWELAELLLQDHPDWTSELLRVAHDSGQRQIITLPQPMPVHLTYLTAWVNKDGTVHFRDDIYGRDALLAKALKLSPGSVQQ